MPCGSRKGAIVYHHHLSSCIHNEASQAISAAILHHQNSLLVRSRKRALLPFKRGMKGNTSNPTSKRAADFCDQNLDRSHSWLTADRSPPLPSKTQSDALLGDATILRLFVLQAWQVFMYLEIALLSRVRRTMMELLQ